MSPSKVLLSLILISLTAVDADPLSRSTDKATLTFTTKINEGGNVKLIEKDQARANFFKRPNQLSDTSMSSSITNAGMIYTAEIGVGNPPTYYTLLIDTGSSNTWVGASKPYTQTSTSKDTGNPISVDYGSGFFLGEEWVDTVTLTPDVVVKDQSIGVADQSIGFSGVDGIFGLGPIDLTSGTVDNTDTVPTVSDNLRSQRKISEEVLGMYFVPVSESNNQGTLTLGGYDTSVIAGSVNYVPLTTTSPASDYWGIDQSIHYGETTILSTTAGIVDTGTTLILIASDAFQKYQAETGGAYDVDTGLLLITTSKYSALKTLSFNIGGTSYDLSPNAQIWPRELNSAVGGSSHAIYLVVGDIGTDSGSGLDFIIGYTFLERYYSIFDTARNRVGFASTAYTEATAN